MLPRLGYKLQYSVKPSQLLEEVKATIEEKRLKCLKLEFLVPLSRCACIRAALPFGTRVVNVIVFRPLARVLRFLQLRIVSVLEECGRMGDVCRYRGREVGS